MHPDELADLVAHLHERYPRYPRPTLERLVRRVASQYEDAQVAAFVPILVQRQVSEQLEYTETITVPDTEDHRPRHLSS
ncbi:MAG: hypothetical protein QG622_2795 [Actinomycetota bacterium]|nr:hypothetical protein [Actinomycetota bacterium]